MNATDRRAATFAALFPCRYLTALVVVCCTAAMAVAQDVTLTSRDGLITLSGTMESYDGAYYRVKTSYGLLTLDGQGVRCTGPGCPDLTAYIPELTIAAPTGTARLWVTLVQAFAERSGYGLQHVVQSDRAFRLILTDPADGQVLARLGFALEGSDQGLADLQSGKADLALSLQVLAGLPGSATVIALDAAVPLVARGNPLAAISLPDLAGVMAGRITNWQALGGMDAPIVLHAMMPGAGLQRAVERMLGVVAAPGTIRHDSAEELADAVAADPWAIAVTSRAEVGNGKVLALSGPCAFAQIASVEGVKTGDYPMVVPLALYAPDRPLPLVLRDLLAWIAAPAAEATVRGAGFVDQGVERIGLEAQGARLAHAISVAGGDDGVGLAGLQAMVAGLAGADRLTPTFRFDPGGKVLDPAAQGAVTRLARDLEAGLFDGTTLTFAGFSDGSGPAAVNQRLSRQRAEWVRDAVLAAAPLLDRGRVTLAVAAYGEALPVGCDDDGPGSASNRRVELWVRPAGDGLPGGN